MKLLQFLLLSQKVGEPPRLIDDQPLAEAAWPRGLKGPIVRVTTMRALRRFAMLATLSHASAYARGASPRALPPAAASRRACRIQMQLGEATRDAEEEAVFATTSLFDTHGMVMPTETAELQMESGVAILPHPAKAATGGEDASFSRDGCYGVFDGVGGWASKGIDSGAFSRQLATNAANVLDIIRSTTLYNPASVFEDLEMSLPQLTRTRG